MVVKQEYKKCEALINIGCNESGEISPKLTSQKSSTVTDYCDASFEHPKHYHVQFVDNFYQVVKRVCVPFFLHNKKTYYVHTIEDIMEYLKKLYDIQEEGFVYALKTQMMEENSLNHSWRLISEEDKKKTIDDFSKEKCHVVFYYLQKETLKDFTLSIFKRPYYFEEIQQTDTLKAMPEIPLFLSPFMQCAMQLGPFEKIGEHRTLTEKELQESFIEPSVYLYSPSLNNTREMSFRQVRKYYSTFYVDDDILKTYDLCHTLQDSAIQESATSHRLTWYIRTPKNPEEYTHYIFLDEQTEPLTTEKCDLSNIDIKAVRRNRLENKLTYLFYGSEYMQGRKNMILPDEILRSKLDLTRYASRVKTSEFYKLIVFRPIDASKSSLGSHNEVFRILLNTAYHQGA